MTKTIGIVTGGCTENQQTAFNDVKESVFQLRSHLEKRGHQVTVHPSAPEHSLDAALVCDLELVETLRDRAKRIYFWPQGLCEQKLFFCNKPSLTGVLWLSNWQRHQWTSLNSTLIRFTTIFGYGVDPGEFNAVRPRENPHSCVYASQDARGLEILLRHWAYVKMSYPKSTLDLYYGEGHWDTISHQEQDAIRSKLNRLHSVGVKEHPKATRQEVQLALETSSLWACPATYPAASSMTALKAQLAGAVPVALIPRQSAYPEVVRIGAVTDTPHNYYDILSRIFSHIPEVPFSTRSQMSDSIRSQYTWEKLAIRLEEIIQ